jgi:hypothetical protein
MPWGLVTDQWSLTSGQCCIPTQLTMMQGSRLTPCPPRRLDNWAVTKGDAILVQQKEATRAVCIGPEGDMDYTSTATIRMARALDWIKK